jgi:hypothetical protein
MSKPSISDFWSAQPIGFSSYIVGTMPRIRNGVVYWRIKGSIGGFRPIEAKFAWPVREIAYLYVTLYMRMKVAWDETYAQASEVAKEMSERERAYSRVAPRR